MLRGVVEIAHTDDFSEGVFREHVLLKTAHGTVPLALDAASVRDLAGARIRVRGTREHGVIDVAPRGVRLLRGQDRALASETGTEKLLVLLVNFADDRSQPWTTGDVANVVFNNMDSVAAYYDEESFGKVQVTGDVRGWFHLTKDSSASCDYRRWQNDADAAAERAGVNLSAYTFHMYVWPHTSSCGFAGGAYIGGAISFVNGYVTTQVMAHEFGHNLGVHHANSLLCTDSTGARVAISDSCTSQEYGDPFDVMGSGLRQMNNFHKGQYGWYSPGNIQTVNSGGTYTLNSDESASSGVQVIRIPRGTSGDYWMLEYRRPYGIFDTFPATDPVVNGVSIRLVPEFSVITQSQLIDATPETPTFSDAALPAGRSFVDSAYGITVTVAWVSERLAIVHISLASAATAATPFWLG